MAARVSQWLQSSVDASSPGARVWKALKITSVPLGASLLTGFVCWKNSQFRDIVQVLLEEWNRWHLFVSILDFSLMLVSIAFTSHWLLETARPGSVFMRGPTKPERWSADWVADTLVSWLPYIYPLIPVFGWTATLSRVAGLQPGSIGNQGWVLIGIVMLMVFVVYLIMLPRDQRARPAGWVHRIKPLLYEKISAVYWISFVLLLLGGLLYALVPFWWGGKWGPLANFFIGVAAWNLFLSGMAHFSTKKRVPVLGVVLVIAAIVHFVNFQDHRKVDLVTAPPLEPIKKTFANWLDQRKEDVDRYQKAKMPYPVIIVAAEGGGIRAAALTALTLSALDRDTDGQFSKHVFLISGVSGGSVGAGFYAAALHEEARGIASPDSRRSRLQNLLQQDFLSGPLGRLLFADLPTIASPVVWRGLDRSEALARSFREGWHATGDSSSPELADTLGLKMSDLDAKVPYLAFNATSISRTSPFVLTRLAITAGDPREPEEKNDSPLNGLSRLRGSYDLSLADAMCLSSRFPGISTAGVLRSPDGKYVDSLVDGGYYDNSGLNTAVETLRRLLLLDRKNACKFLILRIGSDLETSTTADEWSKPLPAFAEPLSLLHAASNVYLRGVSNSMGLISLKIDGAMFRCVGVDTSGPVFPSQVATKSIVLDPPKLDEADDLPLGWIMSARSIERIEQEIGGFDGDREYTTWGARNKATRDAIREYIHAPAAGLTAEIPPVHTATPNKPSTKGKLQ